METAPPPFTDVLVPLDGSHVADGAIPTARALAARFGATVHTVTVAASDFFRGVFTTALDVDEVVTEVRFPAPAPRSAIARSNS